MAKVTFNNNQRTFFPALKKSVDQYFAAHGIKKTGNWKLYLKAVILIPLAIAVYCFLLWGSYSAVGGIALSFLLGLAQTGNAVAAVCPGVVHAVCACSLLVIINAKNKIRAKLISIIGSIDCCKYQECCMKPFLN
jgi:linoleoyl-CoA desaturase